MLLIMPLKTSKAHEPEATQFKAKGYVLFWKAPLKWKNWPLTQNAIS